MNLLRKLRIFFLLATLSIINFTTSSFAQPLNGHDELVNFDSVNNEGVLKGSKAFTPILERQSGILNVVGTPRVIVDNGRSTNRVDLVFLADGYLQAELDNFSGEVSQYAGGLVSQQPFLEYSQFFNMHRVDIASAVSGVSNDGVNGDVKDTPLESGFWCQGTQTTLCTNVSKAWSHAALARDFDQIIVLANSNSVGSASYPFSDLLVVSARQTQNIDNMLHQFGHSFGNLADEYDSGPWPTYVGFEPAEPNVSAQNSGAMRNQDIKWVKWLGTTQFGGLVDTFEGAMGYQYSIYRPTLTSKMRDLNAPFNAPSVESIIKEIYRKVKPIDDATPISGGLTGQNTFYVKPLKTLSSSVKVQWYIDGTPILNATTDNFRPNNYPLSDGIHEISVKVVDTTPWMRDESFRSQSMTETRKWNAYVDQNAPLIFNHPVSLSRFVNENATFSVKATGDEITYQWFRNGAAIPGATSDSFTVSQVKRENDKDKYWVEISNVAGTIKSNTAELIVGNRIPRYSGPTSLITYRDSSAGIQYSISDLDGDLVKVSASLDMVGSNSGAQVAASLNQLDLKAGSNYLGSYRITLTISDDFSEVKVPINVTIENQLPVISSIPTQTVNWGTDSISVALNATDLDRMDSISFSAFVSSADSGNVKLTLNGNNLLIDPKLAYIGQFSVTVIATDGKANSNTLFMVNWANGAPVISPIDSQRMFYKRDLLSVPFTVNDPNGDNFTLAAKLLNGSSSIVIGVVNGNLIINPPALFQGTALIEVSASDGNLTSRQNFSFEAYNSAPVLQPISNQRVGFQKTSLVVPLNASDPDPEDSVALSAIVVGNTNQQVSVGIDKGNLTLSVSSPFQQGFQVNVSATDGNKISTQSFSVSVQNSPAVLDNIPDQLIHPIKENIRTIPIGAADPDGDSLTYSASHVNQANVDLAEVTVVGNVLKINTINDYLGSFDIKVSVSDGIVSTSQNVKVQTFNNAPDISPICDKIVPDIDFPFTLPFVATDIDNETMSYELSFEPSNLAYTLDQKYDFSLIDGVRGFNVFGKSEKHFRAKVNGSSAIVFLLPNGKLYLSKSSFESSQYLETISQAFYTNPNLLVDAQFQTVNPPITGFVEDSTMKLKLTSAFVGPVVVKLKAFDGFTFDEESFVLSVTSGGGLGLGQIDDIRSHWTEDKKEVLLPYNGPDSLLNSVVITKYYSQVAEILDRNYQFAYKASDDNESLSGYNKPVDNQDGLGEKYIVGSITNAQVGNQPASASLKVFAILPDGSLYFCDYYQGKFTLSTFIKLGQLDPIFYRDPDLLISPPNQTENNVSIVRSGNKITIDAADGFIGKLILSVSLGNNYASTQHVVFDRYDNLPVVEPNFTCPVDKLVCKKYSWRTKEILLPYRVSDPDPEDSNSKTVDFALQGLTPYSNLDKFDLRADYPMAQRANTSGWREMRLKGVFDGHASEFAILPNGALYADWTGQPGTSNFVQFVNRDAYQRPILLDGRLWTRDSITGNSLKDSILSFDGTNLKIKIPENFQTPGEAITIGSLGMDGIAGNESRVVFSLVNNPIEIGNFPDPIMHWREETAIIPVSFADADSLEDIVFPASIKFFIDQGIGNPSRLSGSADSSILNLGLRKGIPRLFRPQLVINDVLGAGFNKSFSINVVNSLPVLQPIGNRVFKHLDSENRLTLAANDADNLDANKLKYFVHPGTADQFVGNIVSKYKIRPQNRIAKGTLGSNETFFVGELNGVAQDFVIFPTGIVYKWDGQIDDQDFIAVIPVSRATNPAQITLTAPTDFGPAKASIENNQVVFQRNGASAAPSLNKFTIWVTDGIESVSETIDVSWQDLPPVLPDQNYVEGHWRLGSLSIAGFPAFDRDGDPITYTITPRTATGYSSSIVDSNLTVTALPITSKNHLVDVEASSTNYKVKRDYAFNFTNNAPTMLAQPNVAVGYKQAVSIPLTFSDPDSDLLTTMLEVTGDKYNYQTALIGDLLSVQPLTQSAGKINVTVSNSDKIASVSNTFSITFQNRAPIISPIANTTMKWTEKTKSVALSVSDPDGDTIRLSAVSQSPGIAASSIVSNSLQVTLNNFAQNFKVSVYAEDQVNKTEIGANFVVTNTSPLITGLPQTKSVHWRTESFTVPFSTSDADGDGLVLDAKILGTAFPAVPKIIGNSLVVELTEKKVGTFVVEVGATDGVIRSTSRMTVQVTNQAPKLAELSNVVIAEGVSQKTLVLAGSDPDNDPLTYAARIVTPAQVAYELDQAHDFFQGSVNYNFNRLGNAEKYLKGIRVSDQKELEYVIYPSGRIYLWTGALSSSSYLGTVPDEYYQDPGKLINAPSSLGNVADISISLIGNNLLISPTVNFSGTVWLYASVTDSKDVRGIFFSVTLDDSEEVTDPSQCLTKTHFYDGDYQGAGTNLFSAGGRIGDSSTGPGSRTHELSISKFVEGPFIGGETDNYVWSSGKNVNFSLTYDPDTRIANFTLDGKSVRHSILTPVSLSDIVISARRGNQSSNLSLSGLKINGLLLNSALIVTESTSQVRALRIRSVNELSKKFTFEGAVQMNYASGMKDSEHSFQISMLKSNDAPTSCTPSDDDVGDDNGSGKKVTICHLPGGDFSKAKTLSIGKSALDAHLKHGDIIGECPGQPNDPGDPNGGRTCEEKQIFASPNYTLWNSFLRMTNILELTNGNSADMPVKVSFYSINGKLLDQKSVIVKAHNQFDLIINDLKNFVVDSYGIVKLEFEGNLDGRMSFYRQSADRTGFDFAYAIPLTDATFGTTAVSFNTFQPSTKLSEVNNLVANWLSIVNLDEVPRMFNVFTYNTSGTLIMRREIEVPSFGRADVDGGHGVAGPNVVGYHKIIPNTPTSEYIAQITRFGGDAPAGFASSAFKFAVPLTSRLGQSDPIYMPISNKFDQANWIEIINIQDKEVGASINYYSESGQILESLEGKIKANSQMHFYASQSLPAGSSGYAVVVPYEPYSIVAQSMGYLKEKVSGSITSVYGSQARRSLPCGQSGSYNLFLGMENWLTVSNTTNDPVEATVLFSTPGSSTEKTILLAPRATSVIQIHNNPSLRTSPDTYGLVGVYPKDSTVRLFSEVLRLKYRTNGNPDFSVPVPIR